MDIMYKCDGVVDCADGMDEENCGNVTSSCLSPNQVRKFVYSRKLSEFNFSSTVAPVDASGNPKYVMELNSAKTAKTRRTVRPKNANARLIFSVERDAFRQSFNVMGTPIAKNLRTNR